MSILCLSACNNNDTPDTPDLPVESIISFDGEKDMFRNFFNTDSTGKVRDYIIGIPLDQNNEEVVSCAIESIDKAREMFLAMIPDGGKVERKTGGSIVYTPVQIETYYKWSGDSIDEPSVVREVSTDQPTITFTPVEQDNLMATVTFASSNSPIKRVEILYNWEADSYSAYLEGEITPCETLFGETKNFLCIREASNGIAGVLLYISEDKRMTRWVKKTEREGMLIDGDEDNMPNRTQVTEYFGILLGNEDRWRKNCAVAGFPFPEKATKGDYKNSYWYGEVDQSIWPWWFAIRYYEKDDYVYDNFSRSDYWKFQYCQQYFFNNYTPPQKQ